MDIQLTCEIYLTPAPGSQSIVKIYSRRKMKYVYNYWNSNNSIFELLESFDINQVSCIVHIPKDHPLISDFNKKGFITINYKTKDVYINPFI